MAECRQPTELHPLATSCFTYDQDSNVAGDDGGPIACGSGLAHKHTVEDEVTKTELHTSLYAQEFNGGKSKKGEYNCVKKHETFTIMMGEHLQGTCLRPSDVFDALVL